MPNLRVSLVVRVKLSDGSRSYCKPVISANEKLKSCYALVNGKPEHHPEAVYTLRYLNGSRIVHETQGSDPAVAFVAKRKKDTLLQALADGCTIIEPAGQPVPAKREIDRPAKTDQSKRSIKPDLA